jgi:glutathione synthase/RimK-type ligase-like ATP-grasp enzyme
MRIAYVVGDEDPLDPDPDLDIPYAKQAAQDLNIDLVFTNWNDQNIDWSNFDAGLIRSTWDYVPKRDKFLEFTKNVEQQTKLFNSYDVINWNTDKKYLQQLAERGLPIIPTKFVSDLNEAKTEIDSAFNESKSIAIKPSIGAGARLAGKAGTAAESINLAEKIFAANRTAMIQPYIESVDTEGEKAIIVIDGQISHVAIKVPALTKGGHGDAARKEEISTEVVDFVNKVSQCVNDWDDLLFARVDVVRYKGELVLMELELTEPWLFMQYRPESAKDLFKTLQNRIV